MGQVYQATDTKQLRIPGAGQGPTFAGAENPPVYIGAMPEWFDRYLASH